MSISKIREHSRLTALLVVVATATTAHAQTSGANGSHDPSRMIESDARVYLYSTGGGAKSSADGLVWKDEPTPSWNRSLVPNNQGIWAPDGLYLNGQYLLYGSMWAADKSSALVLLTSPTLDPSSPNYHWTDRGVVVAGPAGVTHSVIDPAPIVDAQGNLWVSWGGGYPFSTSADSIFVTRLDNDTGLALTTDPGWKPPNSPGYAIAQGHKEGSYLYYHGGNYYLWYQTGSCCSGAASTYTMHVARASVITGPYSGDRTFYASNTSENIHGPGHIGIYSCGGVERFTYHYYPGNGSVIGENTLSWGSDGWPVAGARVSSPLALPCADVAPPGGGAGGTDGGGGGNGNSGSNAGGAGGAGTSVAAGSGGEAALGGASQGGGGTDAAGAGGVAGASASGSSGTTVTTAGSSADGGSGAAAGETDGTAPGCSCEVRGRRGSHGSARIFLLAAAAAFAARRRRLRCCAP
jgi:arabinan endo-1,5-alpha-L-arabinosidase